MAYFGAQGGIWLANRQVQHQIKRGKQHEQRKNAAYIGYCHDS
jgi:hypothetical protein